MVCLLGSSDILLLSCKGHISAVNFFNFLSFPSFVYPGCCLFLPLFFPSSSYEQLVLGSRHDESSQSFCISAKKLRLLPGQNGTIFIIDTHDAVVAKDVFPIVIYENSI